MIFALSPAIPIGLATIAAALVAAALARSRALAMRLRALEEPLHELRGALCALDLGVTAIERARWDPAELGQWMQALRAPLERATVGLDELEAVRGGTRPTRHAGASLDLIELVRAVATAWSRVAPSYGARLLVDWRADAVRVFGDRRRLCRALDNLIANALEHGGGRVLIEGEHAGAVARVKVSDGGPGAPLEDLARRRRPRTAGRRGLGLAIAAAAVEASGGRLVRGHGRHGPAVVIELPVHEPSESSVAIGVAQRASSAAGRGAPSAA